MAEKPLRVSLSSTVLGVSSSLVYAVPGGTRTRRPFAGRDETLQQNPPVGEGLRRPRRLGYRTRGAEELPATLK